MSKYDDASWHYDGDFPADLPKENGATHIGMYLTWCIDNNLLAEELEDDCAEEIQQVKNRTLTGAAFLLHCCDGKFTTDDLNDIGNAFTQDYYNDDTAFAQEFNDYFYDYAQLFDVAITADYLDQDSLYRVANTWSHYNRIQEVITQRFIAWQSYKAR